MQVSAELRQQVDNTVRSTVAQIEKMYNVQFNMPVRIRYDINSARTAGLALPQTFEVRLNPAFLNKYKEEYIKRTVVHEIAHIGCHQVYRLNQSRTIDAHGPEWKTMMIRLGADPSRCHTFEADEGQGRQKTKYAYICQQCSKPVPVGPKIHTKIKQGAAYRTNCCKAPLVFQGVAGAVSYRAAVTKTLNNDFTSNPSVQSSTKKPTAPSPTSKLGQCYALYKVHHKLNLTRASFINLFVTRAGCTPAGASTYLSTCIKLFQQGV